MQTRNSVHFVQSFCTVCLNCESESSSRCNSVQRPPVAITTQLGVVVVVECLVSDENYHSWLVVRLEN